MLTIRNIHNCDWQLDTKELSLCRQGSNGSTPSASKQVLMNGGRFCPKQLNVYVGNI